MGLADDAPYVPPLPEDAGPHERTLHDIYGFAAVLVQLTADDWGKTSDAVGQLSAEVKRVVTSLRNAAQPWEGPAADSAYASLRALSSSLDNRALELAEIQKGLESAATAADTARQEYVSRVRSISTYVDPASYERTPARPMGGAVPDGKVFDQTAFDAAVGAKRDQREAEAGQVLSSFNASMGRAARQMPVDAPEDSVKIDPGAGGGTAGGGGTPGGAPPSGGGYTAPSGGGSWSPTPYDPPSVVGTTTSQPPHPSGSGSGDPAGGGGTDPGPSGVGLDGGTTGTTVPTGPGSSDWAGTSPGGASAGGTSGPGAGPGVVGGGMAAGGAALLGRGIVGRAGAGGAVPTGRAPLVTGGTTGSAGRTGAAGAGRGASGASGRPVVAAGGQGAAARGGRGAGGAGGVRGAKASGRYGVPKLGEASRGGRGAVAAGSGSGARGKGAPRDEAPDVDSLTHEDEETWFEGEDDATPPVWG